MEVIIETATLFTYVARDALAVKLTKCMLSGL